MLLLIMSSLRHHTSLRCHNCYRSTARNDAVLLTSATARHVLVLLLVSLDIITYLPLLHVTALPSPLYLPRGLQGAIHCPLVSLASTNSQHFAHIRWFRNDSLLNISTPALNSNSRLTIDESGSLQLSTVTWEDGGRYTCVFQQPASAFGALSPVNHTVDVVIGGRIA